MRPVRPGGLWGSTRCLISWRAASLRLDGAKRQHRLCCTSMASSAILGCNRPGRVLLTNDDGPNSSFFRAWVAHCQQSLGWNCVICVPHKEQSFVSKSISKGPVKVHKQQGGHVWHVEGSPSTCVNLALHHLAPDCDFVVSGPNVGHNVGKASVMSSGTLGAAIEGSLQGRRGVAVSFPFNGWNSWTDQEITAAVEMAGAVTADLWASWDSNVDCFNVNVPLNFKDEHGQPLQQRVVRTLVDMNQAYKSLYRPVDGEQGVYEWAPVGIKPFEAADLEKGGDVAAVKAGQVSVTPLRTGYRMATVDS